MPRRRRTTAGSPRPVVTIKDVAELAGVSTATVSRALTSPDSVSEERAAKVQAAARELNYKPNRVARSLRWRESRTVGVVIPDIENPYFSTVICGIEDILLPADYCLLLAHYQDSPKREQVMLETLCGEGVAGLIFTPSVAPSRLYREMIEGSVASVALTRKPDDLAVDTVCVASFEGACRGVKHLLDLGHERIALLLGPMASSTGRERLAGYRAAFAERGRKVPEDLIAIGDWKQEWSYREAGALLDRPNPPTAVFTGGNMLTLGALQAIHERRLDIPRQVALVGFDDLPWAASLRPSLTVVAYDTREMGRRAARLLLRRMAEPEGEVVVEEFATQLIVRASCGAQWDW
ncbi:MAG: LacI family DNA-binding transcriptional regulator [Bryobacteraceae bacterium]